MSNRQDNPMRDRRLSDTYKAMARERAPDHLNERILRLAASRRTTYSRVRAWIRPLAWAATIGLSFAIVLEVTRLPQDASDIITMPPPNYDLAAERQAEIEEKSAAEKTVALPAPALPQAATENRRPEAATPRTTSADQLSKDEFVPKDVTILRDAEDMARAQSGSDQGPGITRAESGVAPAQHDVADETAAGLAAAAPPGAEASSSGDFPASARGANASLTALQSAEKQVSDPICTESERELPESWFACIRELKKNGRDVEARSEYEAFRRVFPDYDE